MINKNEKIFDLYKPLRNRISKLNLMDSLYVIWAYSSNYTFNTQFPFDIEKPAGFNPNNPDKHERMYYGIVSFELEFLLKEFIMHCDLTKTRKTIRNKDELGKLINYLRHTLSEKVDQMSIKEDILLEFNRMSHRQFIWQTGYTQTTIFRYYRIYSHPILSDLLEKESGLSAHDLFIIGFFFFSMMGKNFRTGLPINSTSDIITTAKINIFLESFSINIVDAKDELKAYQQMNENLFYSYNPLAAKPIVIYDHTLLCPIPMFVFWKITSGLYYLILDNPGFSNAFGSAFEDYVGEVLAKSLNRKGLEIFKEAIYGRQHKRTTDWILSEDNAIVFIECKTKRMTLLSKTELNPENGLKADLKKMASFIIQLYVTYIDYSIGLYPQIKFEPGKAFYPLVVTLEDWYITLNRRIMGMLQDEVKVGLVAKGLDPSLVEQHPYSLISAEVLETHIQVINEVGIVEYFELMRNNKMSEFFDTFEYRDINEGEFKRIFLDPLRS